MRRRTGVDRSDHPALAGELPLIRTSPVGVAGVATNTRRQEEDEHFQWFVDLFVAEYASEASIRPDAPF